MYRNRFLRNSKILGELQNIAKDQPGCELTEVERHIIFQNVMKVIIFLGLKMFFRMITSRF